VPSKGTHTERKKPCSRAAPWALCVRYTLNPKPETRNPKPETRNPRCMLIMSYASQLCPMRHVSYGPHVRYISVLWALCARALCAIHFCPMGPTCDTFLCCLEYTHSWINLLDSEIFDMHARTHARTARAYTISRALSLTRGRKQAGASFLIICSSSTWPRQTS
jgi:hypothetical protein